MIKSKAKVVHFRCPGPLLDLLTVEGTNLSATIIRRLAWSFEANEDSPELYNQGLVDGVTAMMPLHNALEDLLRRQVNFITADVKDGVSVADAVGRAGRLPLDLPRRVGSPRGGHPSMVVDDPWPSRERQEDLARAEDAEIARAVARSRAFAGTQ